MRRTLLIATIAALSSPRAAAPTPSPTSEPDSTRSDVARTRPTPSRPDAEVLARRHHGASERRIPTSPRSSFPGELPTELDAHRARRGHRATRPSIGDTVIVDYVGVRSTDGVEFDNSYDRQPFPVTLGNGT